MAAIPYELKLECLKARDTMTAAEVYERVFYPQHPGMSLESFSRRLRMWRSQKLADPDTLVAGTYPGFTAHNATVQVDGAGVVKQVWVKESKDDLCFPDIIAQFADKITPMTLPSPSSGELRMLEIPLFDMHFGVATLKDYTDVYQRLLDYMTQCVYDEIHLLVGQDLLHTNDMRGHTAKGTPIQQIDFCQAWRDAYSFWGNVICVALRQSKKVHLHYSKGNHDECPSWCLVQTLAAKFPQLLVDDTLAPRKRIYWQGCFIGYGHCEYTMNAALLFRNFVSDFAEDWCKATVRELHTGHLHRESVDDGLFVRRLASAVPTDAWNSNNGYIGAQKRFQIFEWAPHRLKSIHYI